MTHSSNGIEQQELRRFLVQFTTFHGEEFEYSVVTWEGEQKAIAWAASVHQQKHPDRVLHHVDVSEGEAPKFVRGKGHEIRGDEWTDRMEW